MGHPYLHTNTPECPDEYDEGKGARRHERADNAYRTDATHHDELNVGRIRHNGTWSHEGRRWSSYAFLKSFLARCTRVFTAGIERGSVVGISSCVFPSINRKFRRRAAGLGIFASAATTSLRIERSSRNSAFASGSDS